MKKIFFSIALSLLLISCAQIYQQEVQKKVMSRLASECPEKKKGQMAKYYRCYRDIVLEEQSDSPFLQVFVKHNTSRITLAEKYDKGQISKQRYEELQGDIEAKFKADNAAISAELQQQDALAWQQLNQQIQMQNIQNQNAYQQQMMINQMNKPRTTNCYGFGNNVNCTTW